MSKSDGSKRQKVFILDTSVLIHDPSCLERFKDNVVVIPFCVIEELDSLKKISGSKGDNSRKASRLLERYKNKGSLKEGVSTRNGGMLYGDYTPKFKNLFPQGVVKNNDNIIISTAQKWTKESSKKGLGDVYIVSKDINLRLKASVMGIKEQDYLNDKVAEKVDQLYSGMTELLVPEARSQEIFSLLNRENKVRVDQFAGEVNFSGILANQCCRLKSDESGKTVLAIFKDSGNDHYLRLVEKPKVIAQRAGKNQHIVPINDEQAFACALLRDPDISLVTLAGKAGTGKTLMSLLVGYELLDTGQWQSLAIYRPVITLGKDLGYLPGDLGDKFEPWIPPIIDNLSLIINGSSSGGKNKGAPTDMMEKKNGNHNKLEELMFAKIIEILPISFSRGRSLHKQMVIMDESQNLTPHEAKTMITRIGESSKVVLTGDLAQIDSPYLDATSNGLAHVIQRMKGQGIFGHITMVKSERSRLAELAADLL